MGLGDPNWGWHYPAGVTGEDIDRAYGDEDYDQDDYERDEDEREEDER